MFDMMFVLVTTYTVAERGQDAGSAGGTADVYIHDVSGTGEEAAERIVEILRDAGCTAYDRGAQRDGEYWHAPIPASGDTGQRVITHFANVPAAVARRVYQIMMGDERGPV